MSITATEFRKNLFTLLDRVAQGDTVEVNYKSALISLSAPAAGSKLARAKRQHALLVDPDAIVHSDQELVSEFESEAERDWAKM